jgi:hypothetical protein
VSADRVGFVGVGATGVPMDLGAAVGELWARAAAGAAEGADCTEIVRMLEEAAGVVVGDE